MLRETRQIGKQYFRAKFDAKTINVEERTIDLVFVTEQQVMMYDFWDGLFYEILPCNDQNGNISRLNNGAPLCDTHDTSTVRNGLGVVVRAWFDNGVGRATVRFSKRADVEPIWQDVQDGIITGVSVGYMVHEYEQIGIKDNLPLVRANNWEATELSLALVQADPMAGIGRSAQNNAKHNVVFIRQNSNNKTMKRSAEIFQLCRDAGLSEDYAFELIEGGLPIEQCRSAIEAKAKEKPANPNPSNEQARSEGTQQERTRISEIRKAAKVGNLSEEFIDGLINSGVDINQARAKIIDEAARINPVEPKPQSGAARAGADEKDKKQRGMEAAIMQRAGLLTEPQLEKLGLGDPAEYRGMTLMDTAKECLANAGINYRGLTQLEIAARALQMKGARDGGGGLSTGDFSYVLANVLNKTLRTMYELQQKTFTAWARKSTATDFKQMLRAQLNDFKLTKVQEGGEYQYAVISDSGEVYKVAKWGKIINIDWEAIVNDDMSSFSRIPSFMASAVAQMQGDVVYGIITGSHKMYDTNELFDDTNHGNYTSPGTAIAVASLGVGRQKMRDQKSPGGSNLNIAPKFLVTGSQNEQLALQYTSVLYQATKGSDINTFAGNLTPIIDARVPNKNWFLIADPTTIDTVEYSLLDGQEIFTESRYGFEVDALQYKVRSVFGAKALEWRSMYKNAGA